MLQNGYLVYDLLARIGFDTAENEPSMIWQIWQKLKKMHVKFYENAAKKMRKYKMWRPQRVRACKTSKQSPKRGGLGQLADGDLLLGAEVEEEGLERLNSVNSHA